ncbi:MAG: hypothetical protein K2Y37_25480 [Pirellulales bacterium]|nr:hypothetical protein [Pirellulales bacterium]
MPTFKFRFQSLLRLRQAQLGEARLCLAGLVRSDGLLTTELARLDAATLLAREHIGTRKAGPVDLRARRELEQYERGLCRQREAIRGQQRVLEFEIEQSRQALAVAQRELRLLEELAQREAVEHEAACSRAAQREVDDLFAARRRTLSEP